MGDAVTPQTVLAFWREAGPDKWFNRNEAFDSEIRSRFLATYEAAAAGKLQAWLKDAEGALALILVLDQFPRNMFRNDKRAYAADALARQVADRAIESGYDVVFPTAERVFFYLPFEHSEDHADQERCIALVAALGDADLLKWAEVHADIIRRFGRFPHRNVVLGRTTTAEEQSFLDDGGFSG